MNKALIKGSSGFIGFHFFNGLVRLDFDVVGVFKFKDSSAEIELPKYSNLSYKDHDRIVEVIRSLVIDR